MKFLTLISSLLLTITAIAAGPNEGKFEFTKSVYKVQGTIRKVDGDFVIIPDGDKTAKFAPAYIPEEYKKNGLEVTFDGDLGQVEAGRTALNIHKIWVPFELKEKYHLQHKNYDLN